MNHKSFDHNLQRAFHRARGSLARRRTDMSRRVIGSPVLYSRSDHRPTSAAEERFVLLGWDEV